MSVTIPTTWYCGFQKRSNDLLGFLTPDGTDKAATNRKSTVDGWRDKAIEPMTFTNEPLSGFKLVNSVKRTGWNGGNVVVRILDPRGFELEISVANLLAMMAESNVLLGEIQSPCVWGRDGGKNILIPTESQLYQDTMSSMGPKKKTKTLSANDMKIGDVIRLKNGRLALYGGYHTGIDLSGPNFNARKFHVYRVMSIKNIPFTYAETTLGSPAVEVVSSQDMDFQTFMSGVQLGRTIKFGDFSNPQVTFNVIYPHTKRERLSRYDLAGKNGDVFFRSGPNRAKKVVVENGVMTPTETVQNIWGYDDISITVTYDTPDGKKTFTFR